MFIEGLWSTYATVNYEAKLNCSLVLCFKTLPSPHLLFQNLPWYWRWALTLNRWSPPQLMCFRGVSRLLVCCHSPKPWVCFENSLPLRAVTVWLSIKYTWTWCFQYCSGSLVPQARPREGSGLVLVNKPSWGCVTCLYVSGNSPLTRLKLCS